VMEELNRRKAVVLVHPEAPVCCRGLLPGVHEAVLEYGFDTTRAITRILFSGTALRYRDIHWIVCTAAAPHRSWPSGWCARPSPTNRSSTMCRTE
jgi:hypothetical protein